MSTAMYAADTMALFCVASELTACLRDANAEYSIGRFFVQNIFQLSENRFAIIVGMTDRYPFMKDVILNAWGKYSQTQLMKQGEK